ncbi:MAG: DUF4097 family beta strand repeat protein [Chloroflexi bacterium]|nr:DUF4097 family beta strand repeat protein [Chloroflexota bacterium]
MPEHDHARAARDTASETVEERVTVAGVPRLRVNNVSGETRVTVGEADAITLKARKRVRGASEDRAKRMLENVEVHIAQTGDDYVIEPRFYQQERGWLDLFRDGRVAVDMDVTVPREAQLHVTSVSGEIAVTGTRGPLEVSSASGDVTIESVQGPLRVRTVSGDIGVRSYAGQLEANSVSGDLDVRGSRVRLRDVVSVSGDVEIDAVLSEADGEVRVKTVSGDIELGLAPGGFQVEHRTLSGDVEVQGRLEARIEKTDRRDRRITIGSGGPRIRIKSVSGDLSLKRSGDGELAEDPAAEQTAPTAPPTAPQSDVRDVLARLARGELSVDDAAAALDAPTSTAQPRWPPERSGEAPSRGRILRIRVSEHGKQKVNVAIPLAIARIGKMKLGASGLVRGHLQKFGIDLDELLKEVESAGRIVDINDDEDRVEIFVE